MPLYDSDFISYLSDMSDDVIPDKDVDGDSYFFIRAADEVENSWIQMRAAMFAENQPTVEKLEPMPETLPIIGGGEPVNMEVGQEAKPQPEQKQNTNLEAGPSVKTDVLLWRFAQALGNKSDKEVRLLQSQAGNKLKEKLLAMQNENELSMLFSCAHRKRYREIAELLLENKVLAAYLKQGDFKNLVALFETALNTCFASTIEPFMSNKSLTSYLATLSKEKCKSLFKKVVRSNCAESVPLFLDVENIRKSIVCDSIYLGDVIAKSSARTTIKSICAVVERDRLVNALKEINKLQENYFDTYGYQNRRLVRNKAVLCKILGINIVKKRKTDNFVGSLCVNKKKKSTSPFSFGELESLPSPSTSPDAELQSSQFTTVTLFAPPARVHKKPWNYEEHSENVILKKPRVA